MIHYLLRKINRFLLKKKIVRMADEAGLRVTDFQWMPVDESLDKDNTVNITPIDDGFDHQEDMCLCNPTRTLETDEAGRTFWIIRHHDMTNQENNT